MTLGIDPVLHEFVTLAALESRSIARGLRAVDEIAKESPVEVLRAQATSPGKFLILFTGEVDETERALAAGRSALGDERLDEVLLPAAHPDVARGLVGRLAPRSLAGAGDGDFPALGIIETYTAPSLLGAIDTILKTGETELLRLHLLVGIGGKATAVVGGDVESVRVGLEAGADFARDRETLAESILIPRPDRQLIDLFLPKESDRSS